MTAKKSVSIEWLSGCSGCEMGIVDLHEKLLAVLDEVDLVRIPILADTKEYVPAPDENAGRGPKGSGP